MTQTLIGADSTVMTLSGRLEIYSEEPQRTIIEAKPGIGVPAQRVVLRGGHILDVETLSKPGRPLVNVERDLAPQHCCSTRGHLGPHNWQDDIGEYDGPLDWQCEATRRG